jgi:polyhydroxyalkanoate synthesis regulator phasin
MFGDQIEEVTVTASQARDHVAELEAERALAEVTGVAEIPSYISDLEEELEVWRQLFVISAVTEIATLRGELSGVQVG